MENKTGRVVIDQLAAKLFEEFWPRLESCVKQCDQDLLWYAPNENSNSVGNLVIHLEGNLRQWVISGIAGKPFQRNRPQEFVPNQLLTASELLLRLERLRKETEPVLRGLLPSELLTEKTIQGFDTNVLGAYIHVVEHFSYHLGQVSYILKSNLNKDLGYFAGRNLEL
jgi:hypothetical protein